MAAVPELTSEMMAYHSDENDLFFETDGPKQMKCCLQDLDLCYPDEGIQLQLSHQYFNKSFRQVVSLIVAVEKLRNKPIPCSQAFQNDDLKTFFSIIFEEEPMICDAWDDPAYVCDVAVRTLNCTLRDGQQKCLVLSDPCELKAVHLQESNLSQQVVFSMSFVQGERSNDKIPVALSLRGKNLYLSCVMKDKKPTLQLESVDPNEYPKKKMEKRFVFNKIEIKNRVEFESAQHPNWYISTSQENHLPVFLGNSGAQDITDFTMESVSS
ncbi:PREDICTED: interleukin-1 beta [Dipodomys ordii]|uniref:Multifunctional fusion protein n=1 Tax=Dipodomys ordii TaxID=10020 RepID=A0A1S3FFR2_DIPOR|nr:PREDICTED: interleukin-1 beta [Dipodomys ordii]XP_042526880.1 interleukin-1 beta [Dipodomys spectabilis]